MCVSRRFGLCECVACAILARCGAELYRVVRRDDRGGGGGGAGGGGGGGGGGPRQWKGAGAGGASLAQMRVLGMADLTDVCEWLAQGLGCDNMTAVIVKFKH
jgi:hypothetical protein